MTASKEASKYEPSILSFCEYLVLGSGVCLLKQPSFFQNGETHPLEERQEKHPSAYFGTIFPSVYTQGGFRLRPLSYIPSISTDWRLSTCRNCPTVSLLHVHFNKISSVALTSAVNPKSLGGRIQPKSVEALSFPPPQIILKSVLPSVSYFRITFTGTKKFPKLFHSLSLASLLSLC